MLNTESWRTEYSGKRVVVTGAGGFIGSHLSELLARSGANVKALVHYNSLGTAGWLTGNELLSDIEVVYGDIRDSYQCRDILSGSDIVFNLAALIGIPYSYVAPSSYFDTNVSGAMNVLEAVRNQDSCRVIQMSTSEVYGSAINVPMSESHPLQPQSPYSASKISADSLAMSYFLSFDTSVVIARAFNCYGPRQSRRAVIPTIVSQVISGADTLTLGNLEAIRDFTYVEDTCRLLCAVGICNDSIGQTINIGSGIGISISQLVKTICELMDVSTDIVISEERIRPPSSEVDRLVCDNRKLIDLTNCQPKVGIREGLEKTIKWFKINTDTYGSEQNRYFL